MAALEHYVDVLGSELGKGFSIAELVRAGSRRHVLPPAELMPNMVPTLQLANELRARWQRVGGGGLRINAAYRPRGGAVLSQHKHNRALDLDVLEPDYTRTHQYYAEAVRLWCDVGRHLPIGLGLYCPGDRCEGIRVHIDVGGYRHSRHWQHGASAGKSDVLIIAARLGLEPAGKLVPDEHAPDDDGVEEGAA